MEIQERQAEITQTWGGMPAPDGWHVIGEIYETLNPQHPQNGYTWENLFGSKLTVMEDVSVKRDGKRWLHVSVGYPNDRMPSYETMQLVRKLFIGEDKEAYQVFPSKDRYVSYHNVLHWWCCLDEPDGVLPHFEYEVNGKLTI